MSDSIRCFLAVEIPPDMRQRVADYVQGVTPQLSGIRWIAQDNYHITLKFLGQLPGKLVDRLVTNLTERPQNSASFRLQITQPGAFPNQRQPRVIWMGATTEPENALIELQHALDTRLNDLGFEPGSARFHPHLTLSRIKQRENFDPFWQYVHTHPFEGPAFTVDHFVLMRSQLSRRGASYQILQKFSLRNT